MNNVNCIKYSKTISYVSFKNKPNNVYKILFHSWMGSKYSTNVWSIYLMRYKTYNHYYIQSKNELQEFVNKVYNHECHSRFLFKTYVNDRNDLHHSSKEHFDSIYQFLIGI
jgi:hypothetical protein